ncbi:hypothetical protein IWW38_005489, partial [Coemansia aciculifera]
ELQLHQPLLWVCNNFRAAVYSHYCQQYSLCVSPRTYEMSSVPGVKGCPWVLCSDYNEHSTSRLATKLDIYMDLDWVYSGKGLEILSRAPYEDCVFPVVRELLFDFGSDVRDSAEDVNKPVAQANTVAFVEGLKQLAPR